MNEIENVEKRDANDCGHRLEVKYHIEELIKPFNPYQNRKISQAFKLNESTVNQIKSIATAYNATYTAVVEAAVLHLFDECVPDEWKVPEKSLFGKEECDVIENAVKNIPKPKSVSDDFLDISEE